LFGAELLVCALTWIEGSGISPELLMKPNSEGGASTEFAGHATAIEPFYAHNITNPNVFDQFTFL